MNLLARRAGAFAIVAIAALIAMSSVATANPNRNLSCRASAVRVNLLGLPTIEPFVANAKDLPCDSEAKGLLTPTVIGPVSAGILNAKTVASPTAAHAEASVVGAAVGLSGLPAISAAVLATTADATCSNGFTQMAGTSTVTGLKIGATIIPVLGGPQTINLGLGTLFLNQSIQTADRLTTRALRLVVPLLKADVVIAESTVNVHGTAC